VNTVRPSNPGSANQSAVPKLQQLSGTAFLFHFDPFEGWFSSIAINADESVARPTTEESRRLVVGDTLKHYRGLLAPLLYAARLFGIDADRIVVRLGPAERRFDRMALADRLLLAVERATLPNAWLSLNARDGHLPRWVVGGEEVSEAVGVDRATEGRGRWVIEGDPNVFGVANPRPDDPEVMNASLLARSIMVKWGMVGPSRLPATSPKDFFLLVRTIGTGEAAERLKAAEALAKLPLSCDEVPVLLELIGDQTGAVQTKVIRAIGNALRKVGQPGIETVKQTALNGLLQRLFSQYQDRSAYREAGRVIGELVGWDPKLKENWHGLVEGLTLSGLATYSIPTGDDFDSLVLAAPRSREAREKLRTRKGIAGNASKHFLICQLRELADPGRPGTVAEAKDLFARLEGLSFGSFEQNREVARAIRAVLDRFEVRLRCPQCSEKTPPIQRQARLAFLARNDTASGTFAFDHGRRGTSRYHSGTARLPRLEVIDLKEN
jgi:hypothetical protein